MSAVVFVPDNLLVAAGGRDDVDVPVTVEIGGASGGAGGGGRGRPTTPNGTRRGRGSRRSASGRWTRPFASYTPQLDWAPCTSLAWWSRWPGSRRRRPSGWWSGRWSRTGMSSGPN